MIRMLFTLALAVAPSFCADGFVDLFNHKNLDGWEVVGDGVWHVLSDGTLIGERDLRPVLKEQPAAYRDWLNVQSWLYTRRNDFGRFDLHVEYWVRSGGNSGISIRDTSRAKYGILMPVDYKRTPSKIGYEIQINNRFPDPHPTGSIYGFQDAQGDFLKENDWNTLDIESRQELIRVKLNGHTVAEHAGDPARSKTGPIGLQLHDRFSTVMFRSVQIRELK
jgi:Domain of Unknown Function (DUF1080)